MSNPIDYNRLPLDVRIGLRGKCPKLNCRDSNRFRGTYCKEHMYTKHAKCSFTHCGNYSLNGKDGTCRKHSLTKPKRKQLECSKCFNPSFALLLGKCRTCVNQSQCNRCTRPGAKGVFRRGGVCVHCLLPDNLKCDKIGCRKRRVKGSFCTEHRPKTY